MGAEVTPEGLKALAGREAREERERILADMALKLMPGILAHRLTLAGPRESAQLAFTYAEALYELSGERMEAL